MDHPILKLENLTKHYKKGTVVDHISLKAYAGEILGFLGPNGAGKTTTIRMITGLIQPDEGTVAICGKTVSEDFEQAISHVGAIVETPHLYEYMTGRENLKLFAKLKDATEEQLAEATELSGLEHRLDEKVKGYSLGMKQRLGIAVALLSQPKLLILDEPTNGLDPAGIKNMREFLKSLAHEKGVCVFISSHMLLEMQYTCDRAAIISKGKLLGVEDIRKISESGKTLEDIFMEYTGGSNTVE